MIYGAGAVMGFTPREIDAMHWDEFEACSAAFIESKSGRKAGADSMSDETFEDLSAELDRFSRTIN